MTSLPPPDVKSIFGQAIEIADLHQRAAYLDQACVGIPALRAEVDDLLTLHDRAVGFLQHPAVVEMTPTVSHVPLIEKFADEKLDTPIGPYKLLQEIGEGGMGTVYMAEQQEPVRRMVAIKVIRAGMDSKAVLARFDAERQALAIMDHPNIARVFDAGTTPTGNPYFVMELVKGIPITKYCDQHQLPLHERLNLFVSVCQAIQHAHQKGIIHRDIKPSNVLVARYDDRPVPKVIDFGIAKASSQKLTDKTLFTAFGAVVGTLEYMSPEQASLNQLDIDTRSDVYALGVLLYELLTGSTPLDRQRLKSAALDEVLRLIREEEPQRPSTRLSSADTLPQVAAARSCPPAQLGKAMRGELDWIVMRALEKDRSRRYDSATSLARDVERFLLDEPVEACPPTLRYRLWKAYRRHRGAVLAASAVLVTLVGGIIGTSAGLYQAQRARLGEIDQRHLAEGRRLSALAERDEKVKALEAEADQRRLANEAGQKMRSERDAANAARAELQRSLYAATMNLIPVAWKADHIGRVAELLDQQRPQPGEKDPRGFEWYYWDRLARTERRELPLNGYGFPFQLSREGQVGVFTRPPSAGTTGSGIDLLDLTSGRVLHSITVPHLPMRLSLDREGHRLVGWVRVGEQSRTVVWDMKDGREIFRVENADQQALARLSPDGQLLVVAEGNGSRFTAKEDDRVSIKLYHLKDPKPQPTTLRLEDSWSEIEGMAISEDGSQLAISIVRNRFGFTGPIADMTDHHGSAAIYLIDIVRGSIRKKLDLPAQAISATFNREGTRLAAVTKNPTRTFLWEIPATGEIKPLRSTPLDAPELMMGSFVQMAFSPEGRTLAIGSPQLPTIWLVDSVTGESKGVVKADGPVRVMTFNKEGTRLLAVCHRGKATADGIVLKEWDLSAEALSPVQTDDELPQEVILTSTDGGRRALYYPRSGKVIIQNREKQEVNQIKVPAAMRLFSNGLSPRAHRVRELWRLPELVLSPNGLFLLINPIQGVAELIESDTGKSRWKATPIDQIRAMWPTLAVVSPDHRFLALSEPNHVRVLNFNDLREVALLPVPRSEQSYFSPDGRYVVAVARRSLSSDTTTVEQMTLWDLETNPPRSVRTEPIGPWKISFSPDGKLFSTLTPINQGVVWNSSTGEKVMSFDAGVNASEIVFHPTGRFLIVWQLHPEQGIQNLPAVREVKTGRLLYRLEGLSGHFAAIAVSPDGTRIAAVNEEVPHREIKLWEVATGREMLTLSAEGIPGSILEFSADNHRLTLRHPWNKGTTWDATPKLPSNEPSPKP